MNISALARPEIRNLKPYVSARSDTASGVLLNANESPWPPLGTTRPWQRYPDPQPQELLAAMARRYGCDPGELFVGRGSDEAIDLLVRIFCRAGQDAIAIAPPTFGMYRVAANIQGAQVIEVPLGGTEGRLDGSAMAGAIAANRNIKIVFLCSPNNPTGALADVDAVETVLEAARERALVVVDEAYMEFAEIDGAVSWISRRHEYPHLAVLRTLSKAYALAGIRCGALVASAEVVDLLRRIMPPYPLPAPTVEAALAALSEDMLGTLRERVATIARLRDALASELSQLRITQGVYPSAANYLLVAFEDAGRVNQTLRNAGYVVRAFDAMPGHLRISIGTRDDMKALLAVLKELDRQEHCA